ncbi:unnamed protein product [Orchesella dallaii]|uniref:Uncharacterized protein n=1 Tax=Orchesella dallaii TaxID=48710 RepID=A0ABP1RZP2_9HEXA
MIRLMKRLMKNKPDSLLKQSYEALKKTNSIHKQKYNWYRNLQVLAQKWNFSEIFCHETYTTDHEVITVRSKLVNDKLNRIKLRSQELDIIQMKQSTNMKHYQKLRTHCKREQFLNLKRGWDKVQLLVQLRARLGRIKVKNQKCELGVLNKFYNINESSIRKLCNSGSEENEFHVLFKCNRFKLIRLRFMNELSLPNNEDDYHEFFDQIDENKMKCVGLYVKYMVKTRELVLGS